MKSETFLELLSSDMKTFLNDMLPNRGSHPRANKIGEGYGKCE